MRPSVLKFCPELNKLHPPVCLSCPGSGGSPGPETANSRLPVYLTSLTYFFRQSKSVLGGGDEEKMRLCEESFIEFVACEEML